MLLHWLFCLSSLYICLQSVNSQPANAELQKLLQLHNEYRHKVMNCELTNQPPAKYLPDLQWDNELAQLAQKLADTCIFDHDEPKSRKFSYVGQNVAGSATVEIAVKAWFEEYKYYNFYTQGCSYMCGHYTQMVWEKTTHVGCGVKVCPRSDYGLSIVCNYGEGGNWKGQHPYETKPQNECGQKHVPAQKAPKPTVAPTTTTTTAPIRKSSYTRRSSEPDWIQLKSTWSQYTAAQHLKGNIAQTCVCFH
uniref:SCP domain-containing protein n=1 Tax=Trichobilharzia regenti TaxID=157069 RepID=A0AA85J5C1_TRIRE|nr:unnamed protein product [Trichobilharzia regenti]